MDEEELADEGRCVRVQWAGLQHPWCAPGWHGTVLSVGPRDPNQIKVLWDRQQPSPWGTYTFPRSRYTFERRKNLR